MSCEARATTLLCFFRGTGSGRSIRKQPLCIGNLPQVQLGTAKMRLQAARIRHLVDLLLIG